MSKKVIRLAVDAMGGDFGLDTTIKGSIDAVKQFSDLELVLYGDEEKINEHLKKNNLKLNNRISIVHSPKVVDMGEHEPIAEIKRNKDSSLVMAFSAVKKQEVHGVVTSGPTQCVIIAGMMVIRRLPGMKRLALCPNMPTFNPKGTLLLDCGANTSIRPEHIVQYAQFANIYVQSTKGIKEPKCYLLNIGVEPGKGRELEQQTYDLLQKAPLNFCGNIEPKEIPMSDADIVVTDGFSGNIAMKSFEGALKAAGAVLKKEINSSLGGKIGYIFMRKNINRFKDFFNADKVGGAILFGVDGVVVKAHGSSNAFAFTNAIALARKAVEGEVIDKMRDYLVENPIEVTDEN